jgi:hypothetical protein
MWKSPVVFLFPASRLFGDRAITRRDQAERAVVGCLGLLKVRFCFAFQGGAFNSCGMTGHGWQASQAAPTIAPDLADNRNSLVFPEKK